MATTLTAMGTVVTAGAVILYLERRNPVNKLQYIIIFQMDLTPAPRPEIGNRQQRRAAPKGELVMLASNQVDMRVQRTLDRAQLGVELTNASFYPISLFLEKAYTEIEGFEPPRSVFPKPAHTLAPGERIRVTDDRMDMEQLPCRTLIGSINVDIKYGRAGKEKYTLHVEGRVTIALDPFGIVSTIMFDPTHKVDS